jgi:formylglycine-generating enzyme required for sulfatase activity
MGDAAGEDGDEAPVHAVTVRAFAAGKYEVTRDEYAAFARGTGHVSAGTCFADLAGDGSWKQDASATWSNPGFPQSGRDPAVCVSWEDAKAYAGWLSARTGKSYRLLSEAEWEYAARGGRDGDVFPWGNAPLPEAGGVRHANGPDEGTHRRFPSWSYFVGYRDGYDEAAPVGRFAPNRFGLYDMAGNAWEWVADWYDASYFERSPAVDPTGPQSGSAHVVRGGSWGYAPEQHRASERGFAENGFWTATFGFRCALDDFPER